MLLNKDAEKESWKVLTSSPSLIFTDHPEIIQKIIPPVTVKKELPSITSKDSEESLVGEAHVFSS